MVPLLEAAGPFSRAGGPGGPPPTGTRYGDPLQGPAGPARRARASDEDPRIRPSHTT